MKKIVLLIISGFAIYTGWAQNVGIGTNAPISKLHVRDTVGYNPVTIDGKAPMWITLAEGGVNRGYIGSYSGNPEDVDFGTYGGNLTGKVHLTSGNDVPRLTVMPNGNVGINNLNAQHKLDVVGGAKADTLFITTATTPNDFLVVKDANGQVGHRKSFYGLGINYCIALQGVFPSRPRPAGVDTVTNITAYQPFVGEIMLFAGNFAPTGWALCQGQLLPISQNTALFSLIGTYYGGDGISTFALPDLRNAVPVGFGPDWQQGESNK